MTRHPLAHATLLAVGATLIRTAPAHTQGVSFRLTGGQLGGQFEGISNYRPGVNDSDLRRFWQWFDVRLQAAVIDPRVFRLDAQLRPTWVQGFRRDFGVSASDATRLGNYSFKAALFAEQPLSLSARARRITGSRLEVFGAPRDYDLSEVGTHLNFTHRAVRMSLDYREDSRLETLPDPGAPAFRDEFERTLEFRARNRKLNLSVRRTFFDDRRSQNESDTWRSQLGHRFGWGKGSALSTQLFWLNRRGFLGRREFDWQERLFLRHTLDFASDLRYGYSSSEVASARVTSRFANARFAYDPSRSVQAFMEGWGAWRKFPAGSRNEYRVTPGTSVRIRLPGSAQLGAHASVGYEWVRQDASNGVVPVTNEVHVAGPSGSFTLQEAFPVPESVFITNGSATVVYVAEFDYRLLTTGDRIDVFVLPQGRILQGDTLLVDYEFRLGPEGLSQGIIASYGADIAVVGLRAYVRRDLRDRQDEETVGLFVEQDFWTAGIGVRRGLGALLVDLTGEYRQRKYNGTDIRVYTANGAITMSLRRRASATVSGVASRQRGTTDPIDNARGDLALSWVPSGSIRLLARGGVWWWRRGMVQEELVAVAGLTADFRIGLLVFVVQYQRGYRDLEPARTTDRMMVRLTRDF